MSAQGSCDLDALRAPSAEAIAQRLRGSLVTVTTGRRGAGTGVVWEEGLIVTNHHVAPNSDAQVAFGAQQEGARVIARDRGHDLALLELRSHDVRPVAKRSATSLRVGELVIAIGYPWGGQAAATVGVIAQAQRTETAAKRFTCSPTFDWRRGTRADRWLTPRAESSASTT